MSQKREMRVVGIYLPDEVWTKVDNLCAMWAQTDGDPDGAWTMAENAIDYAVMLDNHNVQWSDENG